QPAAPQFNTYSLPAFGAIDETTGAPWAVRFAVGAADKPEDRLATLRKFYGQAEFHPTQSDNLVYYDPNGNRWRTVNPKGLDNRAGQCRRRRGWALARPGSRQAMEQGGRDRRLIQPAWRATNRRTGDGITDAPGIGECGPGERPGQHGDDAAVRTEPVGRTWRG